MSTTIMCVHNGKNFTVIYVLANYVLVFKQWSIYCFQDAWIPIVNCQLKSSALLAYTIIIYLKATCSIKFTSSTYN